MEVKKKGRRPINRPAFEKIHAAGKDTVFISKKEWKLATPPGAHILRKYLKREYRVNTAEDNSGWVVKRI